MKAQGPFVKELVSFLSVLREVKGAPLSVWECVKLLESAPLGPNVALIMKYTGLSLPSAKRGVQTLLDLDLIHDERGDDGEIRYRVSAYAWFGSDEEAPAHEPAMVTGPSMPLPRKRGSATKKIYFVADDDVDVISKESILEKQRQHQMFYDESKKIFSEAGVDAGKYLERLSDTVLPTLATQWAQGVKQAPQTFTEPIGFMIRHLLADPREQPPRTWLPGPEPKRKTWYGDEYSDFVKR